jgi:hypothetical protein
VHIPHGLYEVRVAQLNNYLWELPTDFRDGKCEIVPLNFPLAFTGYNNCLYRKMGMLQNGFTSCVCVCTRVRTCVCTENVKNNVTLLEENAVQSGPHTHNAAIIPEY